MKKLNKKGFTIVELVIVIAVIAILAGVLIPTFSGLVDKANQSKAMTEVKNAYTATLADDMTNAADATDVVNGVTPVIVSHNGYLVSVDANGVASIVTTGTVTHEFSNGKLVVKAPAATTAP